MGNLGMNEEEMEKEQQMGASLKCGAVDLKLQKKKQRAIITGCSNSDNFYRCSLVSSMTLCPSVSVTVSIQNHSFDSKMVV